MPSNRLVVHGKEAAVRALGALDLGLFAYARRPLVGARRRVARLSTSAALEAASVDILASAKERPKQGDLRLLRGLVVDMILIVVHQLPPLADVKSCARCTSCDPALDLTDLAETVNYCTE
jgi:hypothetical protein